MALTFNRTLVQIRERTSLELLDLALVVVRRRPLALGATGAAGIAPFAALYTWLAYQPELPTIWLLILVVMAAPWATAPLTLVLGGMMFGDRPTGRRVARTLLRALPRMVLYQLILRGLLVMTVVLSPLVPTRLAFVNEVLLLERGGGRDPAKRSVFNRCSRLAGERGGDLLGGWIAQMIFGVLFVLAFRWALDSLLVNLADEATWDQSALDEPDAWLATQLGWLVDFRAWTMQLGIWIVVAFFGIVRFLTYIDQRIRLEGWAVELRLRAAGSALEDADRW